MYDIVMDNNIILVDENDKQIGTEGKLKAHHEGKLHRAFSIFVFNSKNELLLQKRVKSKYHSGGLWSNTCCSHPKPDEDIQKAAHRRLKEEMGFDCDLKEKFSLIYKTDFPNNLTENEFDHVLIGKFNSEPKINLEEASEYKWIDLTKLKKDIENDPQQYTFWLKSILPKITD